MPQALPHVCSLDKCFEDIGDRSDQQRYGEKFLMRLIALPQQGPGGRYYSAQAVGYGFSWV